MTVAGCSKMLKGPFRVAMSTYLGLTQPGRFFAIDVGLAGTLVKGETTISLQI